jgi:hypothetical protein
MSVAEFKGNIDTAKAEAALTKYRFVKNTTTENTEHLINVCGADEAAIGIACDDNTINSDAAYLRNGHGLLEVDGNEDAITAGARLKSAANGIGVLAGGAEAAYARAIGVSAASGDVIEIEYGDC